MRNMGTFVQEIYGKIGSTEERNLGRKKAIFIYPYTCHLQLTVVMEVMRMRTMKNDFRMQAGVR